MSNNRTRYGHWHDLTVSELVLIDFGGGPVEPADDERLDFHVEHPPTCGRACRMCGTHPHCDVEYQVQEIGTEVYGDVKPGRYRVRTWFEPGCSTPSGGCDPDIGLEVVPADAAPDTTS